MVLLVVAGLAMFVLAAIVVSVAICVAAARADRVIPPDLGTVADALAEAAGSGAASRGRGGFILRG